MSRIVNPAKDTRFSDYALALYEMRKRKGVMKA